MNAKDAESPENANDEVMEWNESTGEIPTEIWEMVEEDDGCLDGCDEIASVSQPSGDREAVICHKLTQTELRREEVGVQTESANTFEYIDTADFPHWGPAREKRWMRIPFHNFRVLRYSARLIKQGICPMTRPQAKPGRNLPSQCSTIVSKSGR